ncbi:MAG: hypothetical protein ACR2GY_10210 [Phycisphaerales bacterium]
MTSTQATHSYAQRFKEYPVFMQWLLIAAVIVILIMVWQWVVWGQVQALNEKAAAYESAIARASANASRTSSAASDAVLALGEAEPLGNEIDGAQALHEALSRVLNNNGVLSRDVDFKTREKFKNREMQSLLPPNRKGEKVIAEVRFESSQENAFSIIAALEDDPAIESVSMVRMNRSADPRKMTLMVQITVEAWVIPGLPGRNPPATPTIPAGPQPSEAGSTDDTDTDAEPDTQQQQQQQQNSSEEDNIALNNPSDGSDAS